MLEVCYDNLVIKALNIKPKSWRALAVGSLFSVGFLALLFLVATGAFLRFDTAVTAFLQGLISRQLDIPLSFLSLIGSFEITAAILLVIAWVVFRKQKIIFYSLIFFGVILIFEFIGKLFLYHPGPPSAFFRYTLPFSFPTAYVQTGYSFPSGHVSRTAFLVVIMGFLTNRYSKRFPLILNTLYLILLATMVISRIYLGEHWASDTLGGLFLGAATGLFAVSYF